MVEGAPLAFPQSVLEDSAYKAATLNKKIALIAAAADYSVKSDGAIYRLSKLYTSPQDLPCVTLEEYQRTTKESVRVLQSILPTEMLKPWGLNYCASRFYSSFSPEQQTALADNPVPLTQLTAAQKEQVRSMVLSIYLDDLTRDAEDTARTLAQLPDVSLYKKTWGKIRAWRGEIRRAKTSRTGCPTELPCARI